MGSVIDVEVLQLTHPGRVLADELKARKLPATTLALKMLVPDSRISLILRGKRAISAETAIRLGLVLGIDPRVWMELQMNYDLAVARRDKNAMIADEVEVV